MLGHLGLQPKESAADCADRRLFLHKNKGDISFRSSAVYRLLDEERREIRLAIIWPTATSTADVKVTLDTVSLLDDPSFEALSYCWGPANFTKAIELCGRQRQVTTNLEAALRQFRKDANGKPLRIWIDAICINQADDIEKGQQVALMREIYSSASNVRVWFGLETSQTALGFRHLEYVLLRSDDYLNNPHPGGEDVYVPKEFRSVAAWKALGGIFRNRYWSRRWVTQEIVLAKSKTLHCGPHTVGPFDDPLFFTAPLLVYARRIQEPGVRMLASQGLSQAVTDDFPRMFDEATAIILATTTLILAQEPENELTATQLNQFFRANATDHRDLVYGILGLLPADIGIQPDYNRKAEDVFVDFAFRYMQHRRSFNLLLLAGRGAAGLPSWVPDLRESLRSVYDHSVFGTGHDANTLSPLLNAEREHYWPSAGAEFNISQPSPGVLAISGMIVDRIIAVSGYEPENNAMRRITMKTILQRKKFYLSAMQREHGHGHAASEKVSNEDLIRTACGDSVMADDKVRRCTPNDIQLYRRILEDPSMCLSQQGDSTAMFGHWSMLDGLARIAPFFVTAQGRHGLLFGEADVGDWICIVASNPLLLCVRKPVHAGSDCCYELRSGAYLDGAMSGELVLAAVEKGHLASVDDAFEDITLR